MLSTKKMLIVFIPAICIVALGMYVRILQYEPLYPDINPEEFENQTGEFLIPILPNDPVIGDRKAPITLVAFEDFACPACQQQSTILNNVLQKHPGKIKIIWKGLPVSEFPYSSTPAHHYAYCANLQNKFDEFKELAFTNSDNLSSNTLTSISGNMGLDTEKLQTCLESTDVELYTQNTQQIAQILNVQAVPTFFIDNKQIQNPTNEAGWEALLNL